jgi:hypothetical protein
VKRAFIVIGIVAVLIGISIILPALVNYGRPGALSSQAMRSLVMGSAVTAAGGSLAIVGFRKRWA